MFKIIWVFIRILGFYYLFRFVSRLPNIISLFVISLDIIEEQKIYFVSLLILEIWHLLLLVFLCWYFLRRGKLAYKLLDNFESTKEHDLQNTILILAIKCFGVVLLIDALISLLYLIFVIIMSLSGSLILLEAADNLGRFNGPVSYNLICVVFYFIAGLLIFQKANSISRILKK